MSNKADWLFELLDHRGRRAAIRPREGRFNWEQEVFEGKQKVYYQHVIESKEASR